MLSSNPSRASRLIFGLTLTALATASSAIAPAQGVPSSTQATSATTQVGKGQPMIETIDMSFPPAAEFSKAIAPIARKYAVAVPAKSFEELASLRYSPDGKLAPREKDGGPIASITAILPDEYRATEKTFGLLIWLAAEKGARFSDDLLKALATHEMIVALPSDVSNGTHSVWRIYMAMETARTMAKRYRVDPDRVYVAGLSGGGRIASHAAVFFPEVFSGAYCVVGSNFYRDAPAEPGRVYPGFWPHPEAAIISRGRADLRMVLMTGSRDFNRASVKAAVDAYQKDRWQHVSYLEVPDMGHERPSAEWFEKGLAMLDQPLTEMAARQFETAMVQEQKHKLGEACRAFESSARHGGEQAFVVDAARRGAEIRRQFRDQIGSIEVMIGQKKLDAASVAVRRLKEDYGPMATEAAEELLAKLRDAKKAA